MIRKISLLLFFAGSTTIAVAQQKSYNENVLAYIEQYKDLAIAEQQRTGVPASIKLAQGIYETGAGSSELCTNAYNHFGIKCKSNWQGETYNYTDDAKDECFRKYASANVSYTDHSDFLKNNQRYRSLFQLSPTDYSAWAYGLKKCGYATNPAYAKRIIKTIEDYGLQEYTYAAMNSGSQVLLASADPKAIPQNISTKASVKSEQNTEAGDEEQESLIVERQPEKTNQVQNDAVTDYYKNTTKNGKKGFYARKGDMLLEYAIKNRIRYSKILEMNDLPDAALEADMFIYLEKKSKTGANAMHKVMPGETLLQISQQEGIQMEQLLVMNHLEPGEEPQAGTTLSLQEVTAEKPPVQTDANNELQTTTPTLERQTKPNTDDEYITITERKHKSSPDAVAEPAEAENNPEALTESETETAAVNQQEEERVNIANEKAVEEEIEEEKTATASPKTPMTPLDKLKAHMDKTVYAGRKKEFEPKATGNYEEQENVIAEEESFVTTPAASAAGSQSKARPTATQNQVAAKAPTTKTHTVKRGETLFSIAERYNTTTKQLQKLNKMGSKQTIQTGQKLKVKP